MQRSKKIRLHDAGEPIRNWLHSDDTATAVITIIESDQVNEIFNVAGGFEQKNIDTVKYVLDCFFGLGNYDIRDYLNLDHTRQGQDVRYALNDDKLRKLGWQPRKVFEEEIPKIVDYYKNNFKW